MDFTFDNLYINDKAQLVNAEGEVLASGIIIEEAAKYAALEKGETAKVSIHVTADKNILPFDIKTASAILSNKKKGSFITSDSRKVKIYTTNAAGDWPIIGIDADNLPCLWNAEGKANNGNATYDLKIITKQETK